MRNDNDRRRGMTGFLKYCYGNGVRIGRHDDKILRLQKNIVRRKSNDDDKRKQKKFMMWNRHRGAFIANRF